MSLGTPALCPCVKGSDGPAAPAADWKGGAAGRVKERGEPQAGSGAPRQFTTLPRSNTPLVSSRVKHILFAEPTCASNCGPVAPTRNSTSSPAVPICPSNTVFSPPSPFETLSHRNVPKIESRSSPGRSAGGGVGRDVGPHKPQRGTPSSRPDPRRSGALYSPAPDGGRCACATSGAGCWG